MEEKDSFRLIQPQTAIQFLALAGFLISLYIIVGSWDYADALTAEAQAKLDRAKEIEAAALAILPLSHPIQYDAVVIQSGPGIEKAKPRLYVRTKGETK